MKQCIATILLLFFALTTIKAKADVWAVKSNLLYDVVGAPNIGVEYGWKGQWSATADVTAPWWVDKTHNQWCYEMLNVGLEGRYWLKPWENLSNEKKDYWKDNTKLTGHFVGLYANGGAFDFGHDYMGWQSKWFWTTGVSYGYNFLINNNLRLECTIGIGYLQTDYTRYNTVYDGSGIYRVEDGTFRWFGPTKAGVSIIWVF